MNHNYYYLPFAYLFASRVKGWQKITSWIFRNYVVIFLIAYAVSEVDVATFVFLFTIAFFSWQSLYEIGYLYNDSFTVDREKNPTLRDTQENILWVKKNWFFLLLIKGGLSFFILLFIYWLSFLNVDNVNLGYFLFSLILTQLVFWVHNSVRSRLNILTFSLLSYLKFSSLIFLFYSGESYVNLAVSLFLVFPLLRILEHSSKPKYALPHSPYLWGMFSIIRMPYYLLVSLLFF